MNIIIDIQGVKDQKNSFIPKEVAVVSVQSEYLGHWVVELPYNYDALPSIIKKQNTWLQNNIHGLPWAPGDTPLRAIESILKKIAEQSTRIFTRGSEKASYLTQLTGCFIINLEEDDEVPSFRDMPPSTMHCIHHELLNEKRTLRCSLNYATRIKKWLCHSERLSSLCLYRTTTDWNPCLSEGEKKTPPTAQRYEQSTDSACPSENRRPYCGSVSGRSYSEGVDETDCNRG